MNRVPALLVFLPLLFAACSTSPNLDQARQDPQSFTAVSLNVHYYSPGRDETDWEGRRYAVSAALRELDPDILLFQEMETFEGRSESNRNLQLDWVQETVPGYSVGAYGDGESFPITQPILYRGSRFELRDQGFFFFSDTPDQIYSRSWDGRYPAFTTWVLLYDGGADREFLVFNTHLDAYSRINREKGILLIVDRIQASKPGVPVIVAGDFNMLAGHVLLQPLGEEGLELAPPRASSFHFRAGLNLYPAIDHYFFSPDLEWLAGGAVQRKWEGQWPSDHHPVAAVFRFID